MGPRARRGARGAGDAAGRAVPAPCRGRASSGQLVWIGGEAGVGKTSVARPRRRPVGRGCSGGSATRSRPHGRCRRCTTSPTAAPPWSNALDGSSAATRSSSRPRRARRADARRRRRRPLGRQRHARPAPLPRTPGRRHPALGAGDLSLRRGLAPPSWRPAGRSGDQRHVRPSRSTLLPSTACAGSPRLPAGRRLHAITGNVLLRHGAGH